MQDASTAAARAGDRGLKQLPLSAFYGPLSLAEAQAHIEAELAVCNPKTDWTAAFPSPDLDARLTTLRSPTTLSEWTSALGARVVCTPATGACLYFAIHGARTRSLHGANMTLCPTHIKEGGFYKKHICLTMDRYLEPMLRDGTLSIGDFTRRCFQDGLPGDRASAVEAIKRYYEAIRKASVKALAREQWGGDEELFAAVWFLRDPIFVITVAATGRTSVRAIWLDRPHPRGPERIIHHLPLEGEAYETLRVFLRHRVTPMVLVHVTDHFNCLRFPESFYQDWTADDTSGRAMRGRMDQALARLGWYVAPVQATDIPLMSAPELTPASGSIYTPSETLSSEPAVDPRTLSTDHLNPTAYYALLRSINPRRRRRGPLALIWAQAERLNKAAYDAWNDQQPHPMSSEASQTLTTACRAWSASPPALLALLRALPYPEAAISILPDDVIRRLGNELNSLAPPCALPSFVASDDQQATVMLWARLLVLVIVAIDDVSEASIVASIRWLRLHEEATMHALHAVRLHDWTPIAGLARSCTDLSAPTHSDACASELDRP